MKKCLGRLIIMPPSSTRVHQVRLTRRGTTLVVLAGVICLCVAAILGHIAPQVVPDAERARLEQENRQLKAANKDVEMQARKLSERVSHLEQVSKKITNTMATNDQAKGGN